MLSGLPLEHAGRQAWHNGGTKAFLSQLALLPDHKLGVVVLANADTAGSLVYGTAEEALRLALEHAARHRAAGQGARTGNRAAARGAGAPRRPLQPDGLAGAHLARQASACRLHVLNHKLDLCRVAPQRYPGRIQPARTQVGADPVSAGRVRDGRRARVRAAARPGRDSGREDSALPASRDWRDVHRQLPACSIRMPSTWSISSTAAWRSATAGCSWTSASPASRTARSR
ncbi:MAG: hypothetical protein MZV65_18965 [Chromatiales bacterium]|nr:hypothetical protein [Chromatiales bacterium]